MSVQRWEPCKQGEEEDMYELDGGNWTSYEDYARLEAKLAEVLENWVS